MKLLSTFTRFVYVFLAAFLFYLLLISRSGEVYTVWQHIHPLFIPLFFAATALLVAIVLSSEKVEHKLLFTIVHSTLSHSFFAIIFPAGSIGFQQSVLGKTRHIFDNISPHGYGGTVENILARIYNWFGGGNFQSVYSVTFARTFNIDVFWTHLLLAPVLWGIFIPTIIFMITKTLGGDKKISVLAALLGSAFPLLIYLGAISVPNGLGFIFSLTSLYFLLKHLSSSESKYTSLMLVFTFASFLSHFLTGLLSFSFLLLALSLKKYEKERHDSPSSAKLLLTSTFILTTSILPFALVYHRIFSPISTSFTLEKITAYTTTEVLGHLLLGEYFNYPLYLMLVYIAGPLIAFVWIIHRIYRSRNQKPDNASICMLFLFLGLLMLIIDYRVLKLFMKNVPFNEERIWMFRDLLSVPLVALAINESPKLLRRIAPTRAATLLHARKRGLFLIFNISISAVLAGWITTSVYYAYPHYSPLQTTSYELEAIELIDENTNSSYIVICDQWTSYAGHMIVGIQNPRAYYFAEYDPEGLTLFTKMKDNASREVMTEAMNYTDATVAYFIITKPRIGTETYNNITQQAQQNNLQTYPQGIFYHNGEEKLRIFYHTKH